MTTWDEEEAEYNRKNDPFADPLSIREKQDFQKLLRLVSETFSQHNLQAILAYGTLLGYARSGCCKIPWDDDLDLAIDIKHQTKVLALLDKIPELSYYSGGFLKVFFSDHPNIEPYPWSWPFLDIFFYTIRDNPDFQKFSPLLKKLGPIELPPFLPIPIKFEGVSFYIPDNFHHILQNWYPEGLTQCVSNSYDHRKENKSALEVQTVPCQLLEPFYRLSTKGKHHKLLRNVFILNDGDSRPLQESLTYSGIPFQISRCTSFLDFLLSPDISTDYFPLMVLKSNVSITPFFLNLPQNLPPDWEVLVLHGNNSKQNLPSLTKKPTFSPINGKITMDNFHGVAFKNRNVSRPFQVYELFPNAVRSWREKRTRAHKPNQKSDHLSILLYVLMCLLFLLLFYLLWVGLRNIKI